MVLAIILQEYTSLLARPESKIPKGLRRQLLQLIRSRSHIVAPATHLNGTRDPNDNIFVGCADAARADYLVTGNLKHLPHFWKKTKVITPSEFLGLVAPHLVK